MDTDETGTIIAACERSFDFELPSNATLTLKLSRAGQALSGSLETAAGDALGMISAAKNADGILTRNLGKGAYHFQLHTTAASASPFRLELHAAPYRDEPAPEPGGGQEDAYPIGPVSSLVTFAGYVGTTDPDDYYSFELKQNGTLTYALTDVQGSVRSQVFFDRPIIDEAAPYRTMDASTSSDTTREINLEKGLYYVRVLPMMTDSFYELRLSTVAYPKVEPTPEPSDDWMAAYPVGQVRSALKTFGGFVGGADNGDYYRLELGSAGTLTYSLENVSGRAHIALYKDAEQIDPAKAVDGADATDYVTKSSVLDPGIYYVRVTPVDPGTPTLYTLLLSAE